MAAVSGPGTAQWSSRFAFIMAAVGSSVGLGNLWRFSAELGTNGGAAFLIVYVACIFFVGIPVLMSEYIIGRAGQAASAVGSNNDLAERSGVSKGWSSGAWFGMIASFLIVSFYCVVAAWVLNYLFRFLGGAGFSIGEMVQNVKGLNAVFPADAGFSGQTPDDISDKFGAMLKSPVSVLPYFLIFACLTTWLVARGVNKGIETAARLLMPLFFVLLIGLALYAIVSGLKSGGTREAVGFMFNPDFSKITPKVAVSALGQACFSIGIGNAIMITYGSYLPRDVSIPKAAVGISVIDTLVAITAGLMIFPIYFANKLQSYNDEGEIVVEAGAGMFFEALPVALANHWYIGAAFFFLAFFAAITSSVSLLEPTAAYVAEKLKMTKARAAMVSGAAITTVGLGSLYSSEFFDFIDTGLAGPILAPLSALIIVLFTGWRLKKAIIAEEISGDGEKIGKFVLFFVRWVAPVFMGLVLVLGTWDKYQGWIKVQVHDNLVVFALLGVIILLLRKILGELQKS